MNKKVTSSKDSRHLYNEDYFMESATGYDEFKHYRGKFDDLIDKFQRIIGLMDLLPSLSLLDIGCGRGEIVIWHSLNGGTATGADYSPDAIRIAQDKANELGAKCRFLTASFEELSENEKYDRIISVDFIEHISKQEGSNFFRKCINILNPGGRLVVYTFPNTIRRRYGYTLIRITGFFRKRRVPRGEPDTISSHYKQYHLNEQSYFSLIRSAKTAGFSKVRVVYLDDSAQDSLLKKSFLSTPFRHLFLRGLTLIADK